MSKMRAPVTEVHKGRKPVVSTAHMNWTIALQLFGTLGSVTATRMFWSAASRQRRSSRATCWGSWFSRRKSPCVRPARQAARLEPL